MKQECNLSQVIHILTNKLSSIAREVEYKPVIQGQVAVATVFYTELAAAQLPVEHKNEKI